MTEFEFVVLLLTFFMTLANTIHLIYNVSATDLEIRLLKNRILVLEIYIQPYTIDSQSRSNVEDLIKPGSSAACPSAFSSDSLDQPEANASCPPVV